MPRNRPRPRRPSRLIESFRPGASRPRPSARRALRSVRDRRAGAHWHRWRQIPRKAPPRLAERVTRWCTPPTRVAQPPAHRHTLPEGRQRRRLSGLTSSQDSLRHGHSEYGIDHPSKSTVISPSKAPARAGISAASTAALEPRPRRRDAAGIRSWRPGQASTGSAATGYTRATPSALSWSWSGPSFCP
jgi:hypothetical protein